MERGFSVPLFDKGHVRYLGHYGTDMTIVEAARVSYASESKGEELGKKLLMYLFKMKHTSPFEQCSVQFNIKMPIFCMRQFVRHRTFKLNEMSARYTEMWDDFYEPIAFRLRDTKNKQGSLESEAFAKETADLIQEYKDHDRAGYALYQKGLKRGVAKEMARFCLSVANYTEIVITADLHNLMHFLRLRLDAHAQWEMRQIAKGMHDMVKDLFPWSLEAFDRYQMRMVDIQAGDEVETTK